MNSNNINSRATAPSVPVPPANGTTARLTDKDPATKITRQRLSVLQLAQELGSVSKACCQAGMDRTSVYEWKRRFQTHGLARLKDRPPSPRAIPPRPRERCGSKLGLSMSQQRKVAHGQEPRGRTTVHSRSAMLGEDMLA
jgi:transposase-like protein